jgi:ankyrin repeat protein
MSTNTILYETIFEYKNMNVFVEFCKLPSHLNPECKNWFAYYCKYLKSLPFNQKDYTDAIIAAIKNNYQDIIHVLIRKMSSELCLKDNSLVFFTAVEYHCTLVVKMFIEEKYFPSNLQDEYALRLSCANGNIELIKYLIECGADIGVYDETPLKNALDFNHADIVDLLIKNGADYNKVYQYGLQNKKHYKLLSEYVKNDRK